MSAPVHDLRDTIERVRAWAADQFPYMAGLPGLISRAELDQVLAAAESTLPKTRTVWRFGYTDKWGKQHGFDMDTLEIATINYKASANNVHYRHVWMSGPHEVPA